MIDRTGWLPGPWDKEPDLARWVDDLTGYACEAKRNPLGAWCGYVMLPPGHPLHGASEEALSALNSIQVHGGVNWFEHEDDGTYRVGFDCSHGYDLVPALEFIESLRRDLGQPALTSDDASYKVLDFVKTETRVLAAQLWELVDVDDDRKHETVRSLLSMRNRLHE